MLSYVTLEEQWRSLELYFRPETFVVWSSIIAPSRFHLNLTFSVAVPISLRHVLTQDW